MARYTCPSCGAAYNGKKCRQCLYEHFTEEIAHGTHVHEGEPLVIDAPVRKPVKRKNPFDCDKQTRKRHPLAGFLVLLAVINCLLPLVRNWGLELEVREEALLSPEPVPRPENCRILYEDADISVYTDWTEDQEFPGSFPIVVENWSRKDISVSARNLTINGYVMEYSGFYCFAEAGSMAKEPFLPDQTDLETCGIGQIQTISFRLEILDQESYQVLALTEPVTLTAAVPEGAVLTAVPEGTIVFEEEDLKVSYLGYAPNPYDPENVLNGRLLLHVENFREESVQVSISECYVNSEETSLYLYTELPAQTRAVSGIYLFPLEEIGIDSIQDLQQITFRLLFWDDRFYDTIAQSELLCVSFES